MTELLDASHRCLVRVSTLRICGYTPSELGRWAPLSLRLFYYPGEACASGGLLSSWNRRWVDMRRVTINSVCRWFSMCFTIFTAIWHDICPRSEAAWLLDVDCSFATCSVRCIIVKCVYGVQQGPDHILPYATSLARCYRRYDKPHWLTP